MLGVNIKVTDANIKVTNDANIKVKKTPKLR